MFKIISIDGFILQPKSKEPEVVYHSESKGDIPISEMNSQHIINAIAKKVREALEDAREEGDADVFLDFVSSPLDFVTDVDELVDELTIRDSDNQYDDDEEW